MDAVHVSLSEFTDLVTCLLIWRHIACFSNWTCAFFNDHCLPFRHSHSTWWKMSLMLRALHIEKYFPNKASLFWNPTDGAFSRDMPLNEIFTKRRIIKAHSNQKSFSNFDHLLISCMKVLKKVVLNFPVHKVWHHLQCSPRDVCRPIFCNLFRSVRNRLH